MRVLTRLSGSPHILAGGRKTWLRWSTTVVRSDPKDFAGLREGSAAHAFLRIRAVGDGPPVVLLVPPPEPALPNKCSRLSRTAEGLHRKRQGEAIWLVEWKGLCGDKEAASFNAPAGTIANAGIHSATLLGSALADLVLQASEHARREGGRLQLIVGSGGAGLMALQALRRIELARAAGTKNRSKEDNGAVGISVAALAPTGYSSPLRLRIGEQYPARFRRRQDWGLRAYRFADSFGLGRTLARRMLPGTHPLENYQPELIMAWWLGLLDPVDNMHDVARELLLAGRAVDPEAGKEAYDVACKAAATLDAASDDADDEEFAVGSAARSNQNDASGLMASKRSSDPVLEQEMLATTGPFMPAARAPVSMSLLLSEEPECQRLQHSITTVKQRLLKASAAAVSSGRPQPEVQAMAENMLVTSLFQLEADASPSSPLASGTKNAEIPAEAADVVAKILPLALEKLPKDSGNFVPSINDDKDPADVLVDQLSAVLQSNTGD